MNAIASTATLADTAGQPILGHLRTLAQFQRDNAHLFPSEPSLRWFIRRNRAALSGATALRVIAGRIFVDPGLFESVVLNVTPAVPA